MSLASQAAAAAAFKASNKDSASTATPKSPSTPIGPKRPSAGKAVKPGAKPAKSTTRISTSPPKSTTKTGTSPSKLPKQIDTLPYIPKPAHSRSNSTKSLPRLTTQAAPKQPGSHTTSAHTKVSPRTINRDYDITASPGRRGSTLGTSYGSSYGTSPGGTGPGRMSRAASQVVMPKAEDHDPLSTPSTATSIDYFTLPRSSIYEGTDPHSDLAPALGPALAAEPRLKKSLSTHSHLTLDYGRAHDTINTMKQSINSKTTGRNASDKRHSNETAPQEMLSKIKHSFDRSKSASLVDVAKNKERINEIRESIDLKRVHTPVNTDLVISMEQLNTDFNPSINHSDKESINHMDKESHQSDIAPGNDQSDNNTMEFVEPTRSTSSFLTQSNHSAPIIVTPADDSDAEPEPPAPGPGPENEPVGPDRGSTLLQGPDLGPYFKLTPMISQSSTTSPISPINIPPSLSANARALSAESLHQALPKVKLSIDSTRTSDESVKKPKRKPPPAEEMDSTDQEYLTDSTNRDENNELDPNDLYLDPSRASRSLFDVESGYSEEPYSENEASTLPQFPTISDKKHHHHHPHTEKQSKPARPNLFKRKSQAKAMKLDLLDVETSDFTESSSRPSTPMARQPVQFKTTMRKQSRKKKAFNEDKPWKNHTDLSYVTETERKRYEGVWVSNKGLYVNKIMTRLKGISYDLNTETSSHTEHSSTDTSSHTPSMQAAKLSSKNMNHDTTDFDRFHGLSHADTDQLMAAPVVKRLWLRSKLPHETLEQIWNLVDYRKDGTLNKPEFLVGMWLVDQCLYGRKLPKTVSEEVWLSLESIGLSVVIRKRR